LPRCDDCSLSTHTLNRAVPSRGAFHSSTNSRCHDNKTPRDTYCVCLFVNLQKNASPSLTMDFCITCTVAQHCVNGDQLSQWKMAKFDKIRPATKSKSVNRFAKKVSVGKVPQDDPVCQIGYHSAQGGLWGNQSKISINVTFYIGLHMGFFLKPAWGSRPLNGFFSQNCSKDAVQCKDVVFGGYKNQE